MIVEENQDAHHLPLCVLLLLQINEGPNRLLAAHSLDFLLFFPSLCALRWLYCGANVSSISQNMMRVIILHYPGGGLQYQTIVQL